MMRVSMIAFLLFILSFGVAYAMTPEEEEDVIRLIGHVRPQAEVEIVNQVTGRLESVLVEIGERVTKGQLLAQIETETLKIQLQQVESDLQSAKSSLDRIRTTALAESEAGYLSALANVKRLEMARLQAEIDVKLKIVVAETAIKKSQAHLRLVSAESELAKSGAPVQRISQARAQLDSAKQEYDRQVTLKAKGFTPQKAVDNAKLAYDVAHTELRLLQGNLRRDTETAQSGVEAAIATLKLDEANALRIQELAFADLESAKAQVDQAGADLRLAEIAKDAALWKIDIQIAEANVAKAQAIVNLAKKKLSDASLRSPIDGVVTVREFDAGSIIHPNVLLFKVVDMHRVKIHTNLRSQDIPKVTKQNRARVMSRLYPDDIFEGRVVNLNPIIDSVSQTAEIVIGVSNPLARLKPGMLVKIEIPTVVNPTFH